MRTWIIRGVVLTALSAVVWWFGPRAWVVLASQVAGARPGTRVDLDLVGPHAAPAWLRDNPALFRAVLEELSPHITREIRYDDHPAITRLAGVLQELSWVEAVRLTPASGGELRLRMQLRRAELEVVAEGAAAGRVAPVYVDVTGVCLRHSEYDLDSGLPKCRLISGPIPGSLPVYLAGEEHPDPRVLAAVRVAAEWREELAPLVPDCPRLLEVDASNLHYRMLADRRTSQVRVVVQRAGEGVTRLDYGLPPNPHLPRVPVASKARVLRELLGRYPGLRGVDLADLRFVNTWASWVRTADGSAGRAPGSTGR